MKSSWLKARIRTYPSPPAFLSRYSNSAARSSSRSPGFRKLGTCRKTSARRRPLSRIRSSSQLDFTERTSRLSPETSTNSQPAKSFW